MPQTILILHKSQQLFEDKEHLYVCMLNTPPPVSCKMGYANATVSCSSALTKLEVVSQRLILLPRADRKNNANDQKKMKNGGANFNTLQRRP